MKAGMLGRCSLALCQGTAVYFGKHLNDNKLLYWLIMFHHLLYEVIFSVFQ